MDEFDHLIEIPWRDLASETLDALVEEFVTRDGTDYGAEEMPLERKKLQILEGFRRKELIIVFDQSMESVQIITQEQWKSSGL